jgi:hypothetical protein
MFGALVGTAELVNRYKDAPWGAVRSKPAAFYVLLNAAAAVGALAVIRKFGWTFGATGAAVEWTPAMVAGFGAMALFRTSLFTVRAGDRDIGVGPMGFLQIFLAAADREVDRGGASVRADAVSKLMKGLDYAKAYKGLPPYCLALMRNLSAEDQQTFARALTEVNTADVEEDVKLRLLGLELINVVGADVLRNAVESLGEEIRRG